MENPLKERLTGALILVAVLVIVVPEMLSGPRGSSADDRPAADAGPPVRSFSLELGTPAAARTQDQSALTPQSSEPVVVMPEEAGTAADAPVRSETGAVTPVATAGGESPSPGAAAPGNVLPAPKPVVPATPPPPAPADVKPAVPEPALAKGQWWTQLGSFSARDNAERLARDLRGKGYPINIARIRVGAKDLYRVRAGPVANREAAVALQSRLAAAGHKSTLVAP